jgi:hypothetical protein
VRTSSTFPFLISLSFALLSACSGSSGGSDAVSDDLPPCSVGSTMAQIEEKLFRGPKCSTCHVLTPSGGHPLYPTNLEFSTPNLAERMVDRPTEPDPTKGQCRGRILVPKNDPLSGIFVQKVEMPPCGARMPQALPALSASEISCVKRWAIMAARSVPVSADGGAGQ